MNTVITFLLTDDQKLSLKDAWESVEEAHAKKKPGVILLMPFEKNGKPVGLTGNFVPYKMAVKIQKILNQR